MKKKKRLNGGAKEFEKEGDVGRERKKKKGGRDRSNKKKKGKKSLELLIPSNRKNRMEISKLKKGGGGKRHMGEGYVYPDLQLLTSHKKGLAQ